MKKLLVFSLKLAVSLGLIAWLAARVDLSPLAARFAGAHAGWTAAALAAFAAQLLVAALRWQRIQRAMGAPLSVRDAIELALVGQFFSQTLPSAIGGDAVRAALAARRGIPAARAASGVLVDRGTALVVLVGIVGASLPLTVSLVSDPALPAALGLLVAATAAGLAALPFAARRLPGAGRIAGFAKDVAGDLRAALGRADIVASAAAVHLGVVATVWLLAKALGVEAGFAACLVLVPPIVLLTTLPVSLAGWGVREGAAVAGFALVGVPAGDALALSVAFGLAQIAAGLPGLVLWLKGR
ncbi:MAG: flippase-like domain-containing protein [Rhodospirillales bacterium]|nr:flippase-like domain-containing protein [Rhodospirillales bacterium]